MKLCVLQSDFRDSEYGDDDSPASVQEHVQRAATNAATSASSSASTSSVYQDISVENVILEPGKYVPTLMELSKRYARGEIDCFVNLCDGAWDEPSPGGEVVDLLENKLKMPFTGAGCRFYEPTRLEMKKVALSVMPDGFKVPAWRFVYSEDELEEFVTNNLAASGTTATRMRFPMITKHFSSYSSIGLTEKSKCTCVQELRVEARIMLQKYGGCLIEEFVEGREYTVLTAQVPSADGTGTCCEKESSMILLCNMETDEREWLLLSILCLRLCFTRCVLILSLFFRRPLIYYHIQASTTSRTTRLNANSAMDKNSSTISSNGSITTAFRGIPCQMPS
jgi:hypothetical protein